MEPKQKTRQTLKDFLNPANNIPNNTPHGSDQDSFISYQLESEVDQNFSREDGDDLKDRIKETLSSYVKYIVDEAKNIYGPSSYTLEEQSVPDRGENLSSISSDYNVFIRDQGELTRSSSDYLNTQHYLDKIGSDQTGEKNHKVLSNVNNDQTGLNTTNNPLPNQNKVYDQKSLIKSTQDMLLNNNRFANHQNMSNFTGGLDTSTEDFENNENNNEGTFLLSREFGTSSEGEAAKIEDLKKLGESLLYKMSGHDLNLNSGKDSIKIENISQALDEGLQGIRYLGSSVEKTKVHSYRAKYADGAVKKDGKSIRDERGDFFEQNSKSFGQTYNSNFHFFGKNIKIQKLQVLLALKSILDIYENLYTSIINTVSNSSNENVQSNPQLLGTASKNTTLYIQFLQDNILVRTLFPYKDAVLRGMEVCFGDINSDGLNFGSNRTSAARNDGVSNIKGSGFWLAVASTVLKKSAYGIENILALEKQNVASGTFEYFEILIQSFRDDAVLKFFNSMATIGDISFKALQGNSLQSDITNVSYPRDPDSLPDLPGNRVGKSRKQNGSRSGQLAWGQNEVPSSYLLPMNVIMASVKMDRGPGSPNPLRGVLGSDLVKNVYMGANTEGSGNRIPKEAVKAMEDRLDAEYTPLYIQDLRTNEIIGFHAFITNLTDNFNVSYGGSGGYGRLDQVKIFENTTRSVNVDFHLVATSKEDFNTMWFKINKLLTLIYPQWTQGTRVADEYGNVFIQPHSQVIGATPVVRLRVGDVIKSNYSKFNLARIFGIGDEGTTIQNGLTPTEKEAANLGPLYDRQVNTAGVQQAQQRLNKAIGGGGAAKAIEAINKETPQEKAVKALVYMYGSPLQFITPVSDKFNEAADLSKNPFTAAGTAFVGQLGNIATEFLENGFVNPAAAISAYYQMQDPALSEKSIEFSKQGAKDFGDSINLSNVTGVLENITNNVRLGYVGGTTTLLLKGNTNQGYQFEDSNGRLYNSRPIRVLVLSETVVGKASATNNIIDKDRNITERKLFSGTRKRTSYKVKLIDGSLLGTDHYSKNIIVSHEDLIPLPSAIFFNTAIASGMLALSNFPASAAGMVKDTLTDHASSVGLGTAAARMVDVMTMNKESKFMDATNNPFVKAYEVTKGRGLAGVLGGISFNWYEPEIPWETDYNSRAPKACKIALKLEVIHDLPPGLDHTGFNRAPLYNVGDIMREFSGDVYDVDDGIGAETKYKKGTTSIITNSSEE